VTGENDNEQRKRDVRSFLVTDEQWKAFCDKHKHLDCFVPESNEMMKDSYLILDENMCFLDKGDGEETKSESILDIGVQKALAQVKWNQNAFIDRGGLYDWSKQSGGCTGSAAKSLDW
jgi:radical S-adenosyl methionine domain-containing protein 2